MHAGQVPVPEGQDTALWRERKRVWERLAGAEMAAEETRMAAAIIPHLPPALVFHAGQPYDLWETWLAGAIVIRRSRNRELRERGAETRSPGTF